MNILIVAMNYAPEPSGTAPYTTGLANYLASSGDSVEVLAGLPHYPEWRVPESYRQGRRREMIQGVHVRRFTHYVPKNPSRVNRVLHETSFSAQVLKAKVEKADIVLAVSPPLFGAAAAMRIAKRQRVPFAVIVQDIYTTAVQSLSSAKSAERTLANVERSVLQGADRVITINTSFRDILSSTHDISKNSIDVVRNWSNIEFVDISEEERNQKRRQLGWEGKTVLLHAGNMGEKQGLEILVKAARGWSDRNQLLVFLGGGNQKQMLEREAEGVSGITFMKSVDDDEYAETLNAADVLVVNERPGVSQMSMPSKVGSYFAAGRPVVACTDLQGELGMLLRQEKIGRVVPPGDMRKFGEVVSEYREDARSLLAQRDRAVEWARLNVRSGPILERYREIIAATVSARAGWSTFKP